MRLYELESMWERTSLTINVLKSSNGDNSTGTEMTMTTERTVSSSEAQSSHCSTITRINSKRKKDRFARIRLQTENFLYSVMIYESNHVCLCLMRSRRRRAHTHSTAHAAQSERSMLLSYRSNIWQNSVTQNATKNDGFNFILSHFSFQSQRFSSNSVEMLEMMK